MLPELPWFMPGFRDTKRMNPLFFIQPSSEDVERALESWAWLPIRGKTPIAVSAFGDVFFEDDEGCWFLDSLDGKLDRICDTRAELVGMLSSEEGENQFLLAGFVEMAQMNGMAPREGECYDFKVNPILGGPMEFENVTTMNFVVALNLAGQIHQQVKDLPPGTKISQIKVAS